MNTASNSYVLGFAVIVCVVTSATLALMATVLKPAQLAAAEFDRQKNVMMAAGLVAREDPRTREELEALYRERVREQVVDLRTGEVVQDMSMQDVLAIRDAKERERFRVVATTRDASGAIEAYVLPISGKGLWSTLYGYLALEADANTVRGITFYKHGETPGLGGEVENPDWTARWKGKKILDDQGNLVSITVKKGQVNPSVPAEKAHYVDGLSGATITSNGVTRFVERDLESFRPLLSRVWKQQ